MRIGGERGGGGVEKSIFCAEAAGEGVEVDGMEGGGDFISWSILAVIPSHFRLKFFEIINLENIINDSPSSGEAAIELNDRLYPLPFTIG